MLPSDNGNNSKITGTYTSDGIFIPDRIMTPSELSRATAETASAQKASPLNAASGGGAKKTVVRQINPEWELDPVTGKKFYPLPIFGTFTGEENAYSPAAAQSAPSESQLMTPSRFNAIADSAAAQRQAIASSFTGEENAITPEGLKTPLTAFSTQSQDSGAQPPMTPSRLSALTLDTGTTQSAQTPYIFTTGEEFPVAGAQTAQNALDSLDNIGNLLYDDKNRDYLLKSLKQVILGNYADDIVKYWDKGAEAMEVIAKSGELDEIKSAIDEFWDEDSEISSNTADDAEDWLEAVDKAAEGASNAGTIDLSELQPEDVTRGIAERLIADPAFVFATQHPDIVQAATGIVVSGLFYAGGFVMDDDGIYHARQEYSIQSFKYSGYNDFYDTVFYYATDMDKMKFPFSDDDGNEYILWAWKGDYLNLGAGAEMGIYKRMEVSDKETDHWIVDQSLAMPMTLTLDYNGNEIISYDPQKVDPQIFDPLRKSTDKWWVTGFNPKYQDVQASQLTATYTVTFNTQVMYDMFYKKYGNKNSKNYSSKWTFDPKSNTAKFRF